MAEVVRQIPPGGWDVTALRAVNELGVVVGVLPLLGRGVKPGTRELARVSREWRKGFPKGVRVEVVE